MSDHKVYRIGSWTTVLLGTTGVTSQSEDQFSITAANSSPSAEDELVKIGFTISGIVKYVYAVQVDQIPQQQGSVIVLSFDGNVYGEFVSDGTLTSFEYYTPSASDVVMNTNSYNLSPNFNVATYGKSFTPYNYTESYDISIPQQRLVYNEDLRSLYNNYDEKVLYDTCERRSYKVSPTDLSAVAVNGSIKSEINFNVLIK